MLHPIVAKFRLGVVVSTIDMAKLGVVIFNDDYFSHEGLAALKWASDFLPESKLVRILLVKEVDEQSQTAGRRKSEEVMAMEIKKEDFKKDDLSGLVTHKGKNKENKDYWIDTFERYMKNFRTKDVLGRPYEGSNIHEILEEAIKDFQLDTLVLGMAAVGSTRTGRIDRLLNSKCPVVLIAMTDPETLKKTFKISATPADDGAPMK